MIQVRLKEAAQARGFKNSKQLADRMRCAPTIIWKIWTGVHDPKLPMLDRICEALGCELSELVVRVSKRGHREKPDSTNGHNSALPQKRSRDKRVAAKTKAAKLSASKRSR